MLSKSDPVSLAVLATRNLDNDGGGGVLETNSNHQYEGRLLILKSYLGVSLF